MQYGKMVGELFVELATLSDSLQALLLLGLSDCVGETEFVLVQILKVKCRHINCDITNDVETDSKHVTGRGRKAWDVNSKLPGEH